MCGHSIGMSGLFVVEWPSYGIEVTEAEIEAGAILSAAERAYPIWDEDVGRPEPPRRVPRPGSGGSVSRTIGFGQL